MLALLSLGSAARAEIFVDADVCVYGGTSGGVAAATAAARLGKNVVLLEPGRHLGGMAASGLGVTDIGPHGREYIGGIAREFYRRVGRKYGENERVWFEPRVAEAVFNDLVSEAGVRVIFNQTLSGVEKDGARLRALRTPELLVRAGMFIDTTYEGDLLAAAGVTYTVGREANSQYGETLNGVRAPAAISGRSIDPYVIPANPASGLLPLLSPGPVAAPGTADSKVQVYNYRLCLTNVAANRLPIEPPPDYDPARYEALARFVQSGSAPNKPPARPEAWVLDDLIDVQTLIPNGKTDINAMGPISTDFVGGSAGYPEATPAQRAVIAKAHEHYIRGLLHFIKTDPRIPANVRAEMATWGLAADEFTDNGGWPWQLYVREARRMVSDYVLTEKHGNGSVTAPQSIGLAAYWLDSHAYQLLGLDGKIMHEGGFFTSSPLWPPAPFPIDFRSIVPRRAECENLAATFCLSASHAAFASLRMEPVFMITSHSAATAACLALDAGSPIQDVPYQKLQYALLAAGQNLGAAPQPPPFDDGSVIADTEDAASVITGSWSQLSALSGFQGAHYLSDGNAGKGAKSVFFRPTLPAAGNYKVAITWRFNANSRATNVPLLLTHAGGETPLTLNQNQNIPGWFDLGTFAFDAGVAGTLLLSNAGTNNTVIADAVRWTPDPAPPAPPVSVALVATNARAHEWGGRSAILSLYRLGSLAAPVTVALQFSGAAATASDIENLPASVAIPAGSASAAIAIVPKSDAAAEGIEILTASIVNTTESAAIEGMGTASVSIHDTPYDAWRAAKLTGAEEVLPFDDPDHDGFSNLLEYACGTDPLAPSPAPWQAAATADKITLALQRSRLAEDTVVALQEFDGSAWRTVEDATPASMEQHRDADLWRWEMPPSSPARLFRWQIGFQAK